MAALTLSRKKYLLRLYALSACAEGVRLTDLAAGMAVAMSSAYTAVKELEASGLARRDGWCGIHITAEGVVAARALWQRLRTIELFYRHVLGAEPDEAEVVALEDVISERSYEAIRLAVTPVPAA